MFDKQTESEWLHVTAECMLGPLKGKRLEILPTQLLSWQEWRSRYPNTTVMKDSESWQSQPTENNDFANRRLRERIGLNVLIDEESKLFPFSLLESAKVINDEVNGVPIVAAYVTNAKSAVSWSRSFGARILKFRSRDTAVGFRLADLGTESIWDPLTGIAVSGPLKGGQLKPLVGIPIRTRRYLDLFPGGQIHELHANKVID